MKKIENWPKCCICGERKMVCIDGNYYCNKHYQSMIKYGHPHGKKRESTNVFRVNGDVLEIETKSGIIFLADKEDMDKLKKYSWCLSKAGYAVANINGKVTKMNRYVMGVTNPLELTDHKNNNKLDNRKENLRICTPAENARNKSVSRSSKSGYLGIRKTKNNTFNVRITKDRREIHIGNFADVRDAIKARRQAEDKYHGEFASYKNRA